MCPLLTSPCLLTARPDPQVGGYFSIKRNILSVHAPFSVTQDQIIPFTEALLKVFRLVRACEGSYLECMFVGGAGAALRSGIALPMASCNGWGEAPSRTALPHAVLIHPWLRLGVPAGTSARAPTASSRA